MDLKHDLPTTMVCLAQAENVPALSPLDGRYRPQVLELADYCSEAALNRARLHVEVEWLIALAENQIIPGVEPLTAAETTYLRQAVTEFGPTQIARLAQIEAETKHDVKAVEYLLKERLAAPEAPTERLGQLKEMVHIFCTSEDINNLSYALLVRAGVQRVWLKSARCLVEQLREMARQQAEQPMLSHTHGQPATPTTLGHEIAVWAWRLERQLTQVENCQYLGKINGATGNFAAHSCALPQVDWPSFSRRFVESLGLTWNPLTTQIESHDWQAELYDAIARFGRVAHNLATDTWTYISLGYFAQDLAAQGSTGSSTMPHKINPIRFENAEANLELSGALLRSLSETLMTSRLQRDLTDSTTQRNIGCALGYSLLALDNLRRGLSGLAVNQQRLHADLDSNWEVLGEAIQQAMRVAALGGAPGLENPYERLKELTRGHKVNGQQVREFIAGLNLPTEYAQRLSELTPATYCGLAAKLVEFLGQ